MQDVESCKNAQEGNPDCGKQPDDGNAEVVLHAVEGAVGVGNFPARFQGSRVTGDGKKLAVGKSHNQTASPGNRAVGSEREQNQLEENLPKVSGNNSSASEMEKDLQDDEEAALDHEEGTAVIVSKTSENTEAEGEEARDFGKNVSRCNSGNLDCGADNGRREGSQSNSRHICKFCFKEFSSGRALGGHMRAHGSISTEEGASRTTNVDDKLEKQVSDNQAQARSNADSGSDRALSNSPKSSPSPYSKRVRSKEFRSWRSASRNSKLPSFRMASTPRSSGDVDNSCMPAHVTKEEDDAVSLRASSSSEANDAGMNEEETEANERICNHCNNEFDSPKALDSHKQEHGLYGLRRNPKRSRRFIDQDYTTHEATGIIGAGVSVKKPSSMFSEQVEGCTECGKQFPSWKALFGHMRCHPERNWRGITRPPGSAQAQQQQHLQGASTEPQLPARRKKHQPSVTSVEESDSEPEPEPDIKRRKGKPASDNGSDTESIEAAYMNGEQRQPSTKSWIWNTGKRSKRSRQTVRSLHAVSNHGPSESGGAYTSPDDPRASMDPQEPYDSERETAMGLMMLARKQGGKENWIDGRSLDELAIKQKQGMVEVEVDSGSYESDDDEIEEQQLGKVNAGVINGSEQRNPLAGRKEMVHNKRNVVKEEASHCEDNEGGDDYEGSEQGDGSMKPKYMCNTCKRVFKSHQALGGHRASHKKVKGCFARTNVSDGQQDNPEEDMTSEEFLKSEEQLPNELQDLSQSEGDEKERQFSLSKDDSGEMVNGNKKTRGHVCTICGRIFTSGQALGGHKRCHWNGAGAAAAAGAGAGAGAGTSSEATSSTNTTKQPFSNQQGAQIKTAKEEFIHQRGHIRSVKEDIGKLVSHAKINVNEDFRPHGGPTRTLSEEIISKAGQSRNVIISQGNTYNVRTANDGYCQQATQVRAVKEKLKLDLNLPAHENDDDMDQGSPMEAGNPVYATKFDYAVSRGGTFTVNGVVSSNFDMNYAKVKPEVSPNFRQQGKLVSQVEDIISDTAGHGPGLLGGGVGFNYSFAASCNICERPFNSLDALSKHQKTHVSSVIPSINGPPTILA